MGMRRNRSMGGPSKAPAADTRGPPHTPGIAPKAAMLAGSMAGSKTPPTKPTRTDGKLGGKGKSTPFKPQSIVPPKMAVHGKT